MKNRCDVVRHQWTWYVFAVACSCDDERLPLFVLPITTSSTLLPAPATSPAQTEHHGCTRTGSAPAFHFAGTPTSRSSAHNRLLAAPHVSRCRVAATFHVTRAQRSLLPFVTVTAHTARCPRAVHHDIVNIVCRAPLSRGLTRRPPRLPLATLRRHFVVVVAVDVHLPFRTRQTVLP